MSKRKYLPTLAELVDRLSIAQLKEVFITEHKEEYAQEIKDIVHDIDMILKDENVQDQILNERINAQKKYKISSTPTIIINEKKYTGKVNYNQFKKAIEKKL